MLLVNKISIYKNLNAFGQFASLQPGGVWEPALLPSAMCKLKDLDTVVFIVPYSHSRLENLKLFLLNMHGYLQSVNYKFNYRLVVVEQAEINESNLFNKGKNFK